MSVTSSAPYLFSNGAVALWDDVFQPVIGTRNCGGTGAGGNARRAK